MSEIAGRTARAPIQAARGSDELARRLPALAKLRLAGEIVAAYALARWSVRRHGLPRALEILRATQPAGRMRPLADARREGPRLGAIVARTLRLLPVDSRCLMRSLVLVRLLARRGVTGSLVIAVRPDRDLSLAAHAWVELAGTPLLPPAASDHGRLVTL